MEDTIQSDKSSILSFLANDFIRNLSFRATVFSSTKYHTFKSYKVTSYLLIPGNFIEVGLNEFHGDRVSPSQLLVISGQAYPANLPGENTMIRRNWPISQSVLRCTVNQNFGCTEKKKETNQASLHVEPRCKWVNRQFRGIVRKNLRRKIVTIAEAMENPSYTIDAVFRFVIRE